MIRPLSGLARLVASSLVPAIYAATIFILFAGATDEQTQRSLFVIVAGWLVLAWLTGLISAGGDRSTGRGARA